MPIVAARASPPAHAPATSSSNWMTAPPARSPSRVAPTSTSSLVARFSAGGTGVKSSSYALRKIELRMTISVPRGQHERWQSRQQQTSQRPERDARGKERRAPCKAEPSEDRAECHGLDQNAGERRGGVEQREEAEQLPTASRNRERPRLEHPVEQPLGHRGEDNQQQQPPQVAGGAEHLRGANRRGATRGTGGGRRRGPHPAPAAPRSGAAGPGSEEWR